MRNLESNETSLSSLAQKLTELWVFENGIRKNPFLRKCLFMLLIFFLQYEIVYFSKLLFLNSALLCTNEMCYRIAVNTIYKFSLISIRINENLKMGCFDPFFEKWLSSFSRIDNVGLFTSQTRSVPTCMIHGLWRDAFAAAEIVAASFSMLDH